MRSKNDPIQVQKGQIQHLEQKHCLSLQDHAYLKGTPRQTYARLGHRSRKYHFHRNEG